MSLKKNIVSDYVSQVYATGLGILILPLYIKYMGAEAYGLVGFFTMLQAWFALLDLGLTPTIARETARYRGGSMTVLAYRKLFRALSLIFTFIALIGGCGLWLLAEGIATSWLKLNELPTEEVILAVQIMAISVSFRWMGGLYRGVISGSERLVWLSAFNAFIASLRFIAVFATMWIYGFTPYVFFIHQLAIAILEVVVLFLLSRLLLPAYDRQQPIGWSFQPIKPVLKFALAIAFSSFVWILVTQADKLILSGILPLAEYGYFTLAVIVAGGITVISGPISNAIMPRMARLQAEGRRDELMAVYRNATQLVAVIAGSAAITIAICAEPLLLAWTRDQNLVEQAAPMLRLYAIGNGLLVLVAFPYYLQYAKGNLRYHLIGNFITASLLVPSIIFAATYYGGVGAGYAWAGINGLYLTVWVAYVHNKLEPGLHFEWLIKDVLPICLPGAFFGLVIWSFWPRLEGLIFNLTHIAVIGMGTLLASIAGSSFVRQMVRVKISKLVS